MARESKREFKKRNLIAREATNQKAGPMKSDKKRKLEELRAKDSYDYCLCGEGVSEGTLYCPICGNEIL